MTDPNQNDSTPSMDDLTAMLFGTGDSQPTSPEQPETDEADLLGDGFSKLQELLVKPDIQQIQEHLAQIERDFPALKARIEALETEDQDLQAIQDRIHQLEQQVPELLVMKQQIDRLIDHRSSHWGVEVAHAPPPPNVAHTSPPPDVAHTPPTAIASPDPVPAPLPAPSDDTKTSLALVKLLMPIISSMLDRKLDALETRVIAAIQEHAGDAIAPPPSLSIQLSGVDSDPP
jgi:hypothetical protein